MEGMEIFIAGLSVFLRGGYFENCHEVGVHPKIFLLTIGGGVELGVGVGVRGGVGVWRLE